MTASYMNTAAWPFTGREAEFSSARAWVQDEAVDTLLIYGPAGVGKTRFAEELVQDAQARGLSCTRVKATAAASQLPLGALGHLLTSDVAEAAGPVELFQEVRRSFLSRVEPGGAGRRGPTLVFVDDLHLLDTTSTVLLTQLLDAQAISMIATLRSGTAPSSAVSSFQRGDRSRQINLETLPLDQAADCLEGVLGGQVERSAARRIAEVSGGNWLFMRELVDHAVKNKDLVRESGVWQLPEDLASPPQLADLLLSRLGGLSEGQQQVMETLALCEPVEYTALSSLIPAEELDEMERDALLRISLDGRRLTATLPHPMYGEAIRARLSAGRRTAILHQQVAQVHSCGARRRSDALRIATWQLEADGVAEPGILVTAALLARHAHDWHKVVALLSATPGADQHGYLQQLLAESLHQLGKWEDAEHAFARAHALAANDPELLAIAMERTQNMLYGFGSAQRALAANDEAKSRATSPEAHRVLQVNEAAIRTTSGQPRQGLSMLRDLSNLRTPRVRLWAQSMTTLGYALTGQTQPAVETGFRSYAEHQDLDAQEEPSGPSMPASAQVIPLLVALTEAGQLARGHDTGEQALQDAVAMGALQPQIWLGLNLGRCSLVAGHLHEARRYLAEALAVARQRRYPRVLSLASAYLTAAEAQMGQTTFTAATTAASQDTARDYLAGEEQIGRAWQLAAEGRNAEARSLLLAASGLAGATGQLASEGWLLTEAARLGAYEETRDRLHQIAESSDSPLYTVRAQWVEAACSQNPGQLLTAGQECAELGLHLMAAEAAALASAHFRDAGNQRRATGALVVSHGYLRHCGGAVSTPLITAQALPEALSARELEIAQKAASRLSSKEIAEDLVLSTRTVDNHLQRIYTKLGVASRRELAIVLAAAGNSSHPGQTR
ncbi:LuxR C-terminal-related transcriptional regulator [Streptomyces sp. NPDC004787]|uniref:helix-turn-helix transcriptional regulator n=1 Tax=Streptomyces sp. NPDC004787 TaxID=3154291 RepID=UPI0033A433E0